MPGRASLGRLAMAVLVLNLAAIACLAQAPTIEIALQEGVDGYEGTDDVMMYQPSSVAFVNYGATPSMGTGINRWGEHYTAILRFDLSLVPQAAEVVAARVVLYHSGGTYPFRDVAVDLHALAPANAGWIEGNGDGTRIPTQGAPCWSYLAHDTRRWAGEGGARKAGVDYVTEWSAQATAHKGQAEQIEFDLPASLIGRWIADPATNAGLHLWPQMAKEKGDYVSFSTSEAEQPEHRPTLVISLKRTDRLVDALARRRVGSAVASADRHRQALADEIALEDGLDSSRAHVDAVADTLRGISNALHADEQITEAETAQMLAGVSAQLSALAEIRAGLPADRGRAFNTAHGYSTEFALGSQSPMVKVFGRDVPFEGRFTETVDVSLARNEHEPAQVLVVPVDADLTGVTWRIEGFDSPGLQVNAVPVGYVKSRIPQPVSLPMPSEWWPDPLLDFLTTVDVPRGQCQPLWVDVHASAAAAPGIHTGRLVVSAEGVAARSIAIRAHVYDFALPVEQNLKTVWGLTTSMFTKLYGDRFDREMAFDLYDLLLDHRLAVNDLYRTRSTGIAGEDAMHYLTNPEGMRFLMERGSGWWNVGYVLAPQHVLKDDRPFGVDSYDEYLRKCVEMFTPDVERLHEAGWPKDRMGIYFLDETSDFETLGKAARVIKQAFPDIPLMTTGYDRTYGLEDTPTSKYLDIWVPLTPRYHEDRERIIRGRTLGKQAWWYICVGPRETRSLNWFTQYPAIRSRLLMGVAAWRYQTDGFLYYRLDGWRNNDAIITSGPYTDWVPQYSGTLPDGDGQLLCAGPDGAISTIRLENIRDGIEDYEYLWRLRELIEAARAMDLPSREEAAVARAAKLLVVPDELLRDVNTYSEDPEVLAQHRERIANAICRLQGIVESR